MSLLAYGEPCALDAGRPEPAHVEISSNSGRDEAPAKTATVLNSRIQDVAGLTGSPI
jgi:hypothetical protein